MLLSVTFTTIVNVMVLAVVQYSLLVGNSVFHYVVPFLTVIPCYMMNLLGVLFLLMLYSCLECLTASY